MQVMLIIYGSDEAFASLSQTQIDEVGETHRRVQSELHRRGELVDHAELAFDRARHLVPAAGATRVADGPLELAGLSIGGYYLLDCADLDRAVEIAAEFKEAAYAPIEVRVVSRQTSWDERTPSAT